MTIPAQPGPPDLERLDPRIVILDMYLNDVYCHVWTRVGGGEELTNALVERTFSAAVDRYADRDRPVLVWLCAIADEVVVAHYVAAMIR